MNANGAGTSPSAKISIVTPNFNGAAFIERTMKSVLDQNYPNLEYIVVDGASDDESMRIIERYADRLAHVICEPDSGHTEAINKGFALATGEIMGWINSDDILLPGALNAAACMFGAMPDIEWITGRPCLTMEKDIVRVASPLRPWSLVRFLAGDWKHVQQESTFWRRRLWERAGGKLSEDYPLASDFELWTRFFLSADLYSAEVLLGAFRMRDGQISRAMADRYHAECDIALDQLWASLKVDRIAEALPVILTARAAAARGERVRDDARLKTFDPAELHLDFRDMSCARRTSPQARAAAAKPSVSSSAALSFSGGDYIDWRDGPDFAAERLCWFECRFRSHVQDRTPGTQMDETLPRMPFIVGPIVGYDRGGGALSIHIKTEREPVVIHCRAWEDEFNHLRVALSDGYYIAILNGERIGEGPLANHAAALPLCRMGGGYLKRRWLGDIADVTVATQQNIGGPVLLRELHNTDLASPPRVRWRRSQKPSDLSPLKNRFAGKRCFVMGNGPSLNKTDLTKLKGEHVFACNAAFLLFDRIEWRPSLYACVDVRVIRDRARDIVDMLDAHPDMMAFFPSEITLHDGSGKSFDTRTIIPPAENRFFFNEVRNSMEDLPTSMFSLDANERVVQPYTVAITMLQLAAYLGFNPIYLIGCDTSYQIPKSVKEEGRKIGERGLLLTSTEDDDPNHFDARYFGKGREWHNPQVDKMMQHHQWSREALNGFGVSVLNATVGGQLEVYPRVDFDSLF